MQEIKILPVISLDGQVIRGLGFARDVSIPAQMPCFEKVIPEIKGSYHGTINLCLPRPLRIVYPDQLIPCAWQVGAVPELFGFLKISIEFPIGGEPKQAWIYIPYNSPHLNNRYQVEIISQEIKGLEYGSRCRINLPRGNEDSESIVVS
jgi:hypothetical protein